MPNIQLAQVKDDEIFNVAEFDADTYEATLAQWVALGLIDPAVEHIPMSELPDGAGIGWLRLDEGVWIDPNAEFPEDEE